MVGRIARYKGDNQWQDMADAGPPEKPKEARRKVAATLDPKTEETPPSAFPSPMQMTLGVTAGRGPAPNRSGQLLGKEKEAAAVAKKFRRKASKIGGILYDMTGLDHILSGQYLKDAGDFMTLAEPGMGTGVDGRRTPEENDRVTDIAGAFGMDAVNVAIGSSPFSRPSNSVGMFAPLRRGGPGMTEADETALKLAEDMWNAVPNDKRTFALARDIWSKTGLTYVPGTDGRFVKEVADPTWKPGVKEQVIDKGVPFVGRWDQAFDAPEMLPYTPDVPAMPTYLAHDSHTVQGAYSPKAGGGSDMLAMGPEFRPGSDWGNGSLLEAAGHETQHAIFDQATGPDGYSLPGGSSPKGLPQFVKNSRLYGPDPMEGYRASTGENFSHAIMRRYGWTPEKRAARMPYDDMPQPPEGLQWTRLLKKSENGPGYVGQFGWADPRVSGGIDIMDTTLYDTIPAKSQVRKMGETWKDAQTPTPPERQGPPAPPPRPWREQLGIGQGQATDQLTDEIFLPRNAAGAPTHTLNLAKQMEAEGASPEEIWKATQGPDHSGWWRTPDGQWRWETDDSVQKFTNKGRRVAADPNAMINPPEPLGTLVEHPEFFNAVPSARGAPTRLANDGGASGYFDPSRGSIDAYGSPFNGEVNQHRVAVGEGNLARVTNHEMQHLADNELGMPTGANDKEADLNWVQADDINHRPDLGSKTPSKYTVYRRSSGENLARASDKRFYLSREERNARHPAQDMDHPAQDQWVRWQDGSIDIPRPGEQPRNIRGPQSQWTGKRPPAASADAAGLTDEMAATPVRGGTGGPPRARLGKIGDNGGPPMRSDYDPLEVINARAQQMDLPKKQRVQPSGKDPLFDTSREAYERTKHVLPQQVLPSPRVGSIEELKGALQRSHPLAVHADAIAGRIAEKIAPYKGTETQYFYNMAPVYEKLRQTGLTEEESLQWLHDFGAAYGGTSPRTDTENNIRNAFLLLNKRERGMPFDSVEGPGTTSMSGDGAGLSEKGFPMMDMHRELTRDLLNDVDRMNTNPKPTNFKGGAQGNLKTVTADTHAIRGVLVAFNELHPGQIPGGWFKSKADFANYQQDPVGWMKNPKNIAEKINDSLGSRTVNKVPSQVEYGVMDDIYRLVGSKADVEPAEAQSLGWFTSGSDTNLASAPHSIPSLIDQRVDVTAQLMGVPKEVVWQKLARFKTPVAGISGLMVADQMRRRMEQEQERTNAY